MEGKRSISLPAPHDHTLMEGKEEFVVAEEQFLRISSETDREQEGKVEGEVEGAQKRSGCRKRGKTKLTHLPTLTHPLITHHHPHLRCLCFAFWFQEYFYHVFTFQERSHAPNFVMRFKR